MESEAKAALLALGQDLQSQGVDQDEVRAVLMDLVDAVCRDLGHEEMPPRCDEG